MVVRFVKKEVKKKSPFEPSGVDRKAIVKVLKQTGKIISLPRDKGRPARLPGKRISASGNEYWETRKNRSDKAGSRV